MKERQGFLDEINNSQTILIQASEGSKTEWELFPTTTTTTADVDRETHENQLNELISLEPLPSENLGFPHSVSTPAVNRVQADPFLNDFQLPKSGPLADFNTNNSGNVPKTASQQHVRFIRLILALITCG